MSPTCVMNIQPPNPSSAVKLARSNSRQRRLQLRVAGAQKVHAERKVSQDRRKPDDQREGHQRAATCGQHDHAAQDAQAGGGSRDRRQVAFLQACAQRYDEFERERQREEYGGYR